MLTSLELKLLGDHLNPRGGLFNGDLIIVPLDLKEPIPGANERTRLKGARAALYAASDLRAQAERPRSLKHPATPNFTLKYAGRETLNLYSRSDRAAPPSLSL